MEEDAPEVSLADMAMGQASASVAPAPSSIGGAVLEEMPPQEEWVPLGVNAEPSGPLVLVGGDAHE
jgi:hypothetical protein